METICRIGQPVLCETKGCEWKRVFKGHCGKKPSEIEIKFRESREKIIRKVDSGKGKPLEIVFVNEAKNEFQLPKQEDWIKKIKVKL